MGTGLDYTRDSVAKSSEDRELAELRRFLRGDAEQLADEFDLGHHISFAATSILIGYVAAHFYCCSFFCLAAAS
jgi:hypothetical protein